MEKNNGTKQMDERIKSIPVFIGTDRQDIVESINKHIQDKYNTEENRIKYVISVIGEEFFNKFLEGWFLNSLSKEEKERMQNFKTDKALEQQALNQAMNLEAGIPQTEWPMTSKKLQGHFAYYFDKKISNSEMDALIGFMISYGYMVNTTPDRKHHESLYNLSVKTEDRIKSLDVSKRILLIKIEDLKGQVKLIELDKNKLIDSLLVKDDTETGEFDNNSVMTEEGVLKHTTEHLNDR